MRRGRNRFLLRSLTKQPRFPLQQRYLQESELGSLTWIKTTIQVREITGCRDIRQKGRRWKLRKRISFIRTCRLLFLPSLIVARRTQTSGGSAPSVTRNFTQASTSGALFASSTLQSSKTPRCATSSSAKNSRESAYRTRRGNVSKKREDKRAGSATYALRRTMRHNVAFPATHTKIRKPRSTMQGHNSMSTTLIRWKMGDTTKETTVQSVGNFMIQGTLHATTALRSIYGPLISTRGAKDL